MLCWPISQTLVLSVVIHGLCLCIALPQENVLAPTPGENVGQYEAPMENGPNIALSSASGASFAITSSEVEDDRLLDFKGGEMVSIIGLNTIGSSSDQVVSNGSDSGTVMNARDLSNPQLTSRGRTTTKSRRQASLAQDISVGFRNLTGGVGYNLTLPGRTCASTVLPPFLDPGSNNIVVNGTLAEFWHAHSVAQKTSDEWNLWIRSQIEEVLSKLCGGGLKTKLSEKRAASNPISSERKDVMLHQSNPRMDQSSEPQRSRFALGTGFWTLTFLATVPGFGLTIASLGATLQAAAEERIGPWKEAALITSIGFSTAVVTIFLNRLDTQAAFGRFEIRLYALVISVVAAIAESMHSCFTGQALANAIQAYEQRFNSRGRTPPPAIEASVPGVAAGTEIEMQPMC